jgi:hypothetical protein
MIDYKVNNLRLSQNGISATIDIYNGAITTEAETNQLTSDTSDVTRYRRTAKVKTIQVNLDASEVTDLFLKYVNKRIVDEATQRGTTVITKQNNTTL